MSEGPVLSDHEEHVLRTLASAMGNSSRIWLSIRSLKTRYIFLERSLEKEKGNHSMETHVLRRGQTLLQRNLERYDPLSMPDNFSSCLSHQE